MSYLLFNGLAKKKNTFTVASDHEYKEIDSINIVQSFVNNSVYCRVLNVLC